MNIYTCGKLLSYWVFKQVKSLEQSNFLNSTFFTLHISENLKYSYKRVNSENVQVNDVRDGALLQILFWLNSSFRYINKRTYNQT